MLFGVIVMWAMLSALALCALLLPLARHAVQVGDCRASELELTVRVWPSN